MMASRRVLDNDEARTAHNVLVFYLHQHLTDYDIKELKELFRDTPLTPRQIGKINTVFDLFEYLLIYEKISVGNYEQFTPRLRMVNPRLANYVKAQEDIIRGILNEGGAGPSKAKQLKPADQHQQQSTEIHADLRPLIAKAKERIKTEKREKQFLETKAFHDAQDKLRKKRVIIIKGNTGDGKTSTAIQLMDWLIKEQQCRQPLQLHKIKKLDLLSPNSNLVTFIDDMFGEKNVGSIDVQEWNKRITDVKTLFIDDQSNPNFLLVTIRNEIFNVLGKRSFEPVFTKDNTIDFSSVKYQISEERKELLNMYKPDNISWTEKEIESILTCASGIGFPQCCQLFYKSVKLQEKRAKFFEKPYEFFIKALSRLPECSAILFLFLNEGKIKVKDLDPNSDKINKTLLEESFDINLIDGEEDKSSLTYKKKVGFVKESLDRLLDFLVVKDKPTCFHDEEYRFNHDSVHVTVALLYGEKTTCGYIQNCPSKFLSYLTISKTSSNMIVISSDHYACLCERLLREFECKESLNDIMIGSLDVWKDPVFVVRFFRLLNERKVDKLAVLNKACRYCVKECVIDLLNEGVKPDEDTPLWSLITGSTYGVGKGDVDVLKKVARYLNDEIKIELLNKACESGSEECGLYLLSEGVKPANDILMYVAWGGNVELLHNLLLYDVNPTEKFEYNHNVLHKACLTGKEEMVTELCDRYPYLVHDTDDGGQTPLHVAAAKGSISIFQIVERTILETLYKHQQHKCETIDGRIVHRNCVCAQHISQLVDNDGWTVLHVSCLQGHREICVYLCEYFPSLITAVDNGGRTVLHWSCERGYKEICLYLCENFPSLTSTVDNKGQTVLHVTTKSAICVHLCKNFPSLTTAVDNRGRHCLHQVAESYWADVDTFIECETHIKQYLESTGGKYDITTILDEDGKSVLDLAKERKETRSKLGFPADNRLFDHLIKVFGK